MEGGPEHPALTAALRRWGAQKILYSEWIISADSTTKAIYDDLIGAVDNNDRLIVLQLEGQATWRPGGLMIADDVFRIALNR